jgi:hypothetical protein
MKILKANPHLFSMLQEPALTTDGFSDAVVDETVVESYGFYSIDGDEDSKIMLERTIEYNAARDKLSRTTAQVSNYPTIVTATTDYTTNTQIPLDALTTIEITGYSFGADVEDVIIYAIPTAPATYNGKPLFDVKYSCTVVSSSDLDDPEGGDAEIVVTVHLSSKERYKSAMPGPVTLVVINKKRGLETFFSGLVAV